MNKQINSSPVFFTVLGRSILRNHDPVIKAHAYAQISAEIGRNLYAMEYIHGGNKQDQHDDDAWQWQTATCV